MFEVGTKVYAWDFNVEDMEKCMTSGDPIIGNVDSVDIENHEYIIKSVVNEKFYRHKADCVFEVGTGPTVKKTFDDGLLPFFDKV